MTTNYDTLDESESYCPLAEKLGEPATFQFPDRCCRCLTPSPTKEWKATNIGKRVEGTDLHVTYHLQVPVCSDCWSTLKRTRIQLTVVTLFLALLAAMGLWYYDPFDSRSAEPKNVFMIWSVTAIFLAPIFLGVYYGIALIFVPRNLRGVAYLNGDGDKLTFFNPEYQRLFQNYYPPSDTRDPSHDGIGAEPVRW
jgi:hypothetical protein